MTPTRWLIVAFWAVMLVIGAVYALQAITAPPPPKVPEKHWFPPPLPGTTPTVSPNADVRMTHYVEQPVSNSPSFTVAITLQNFGQKKATDVQIKIRPYIGNMNTVPGENGPDEIPAQAGGDPMANVTQWVPFPDIDPGQTSTQTVTLPVRSDADPAQSQPHPELQFQTAP